MGEQRRNGGEGRAVAKVRVRGGGLPVYRMGTTRRVTDALRRSPEFRSI